MRFDESAVKRIVDRDPWGDLWWICGVCVMWRVYEMLLL